jgi:hypothetical protein
MFDWLDLEDRCIWLRRRSCQKLPVTEFESGGFELAPLILGKLISLVAFKESTLDSLVLSMPSETILGGNPGGLLKSYSFFFEEFDCLLEKYLHFC